MSSPHHVINATRLTYSHLNALIQSQALALRIYPFINSSTCSNWQEQLKKTNVLSRYSNAHDVPVYRIGMTLFETQNDPQKIAIYMTEGQNYGSVMNAVFGEKAPLDSVHAGLSSSWHGGCHVQTYYDRPMNQGIIRSFESTSNGGLPPHIDSLLKDLPDTDEFKHLQCQLAANLYIDVPQKGGELEIWNYEPDSDELSVLYNGIHDFIDPQKIPVQSITIKPRVGELIIFRSNCVHSVRPSSQGTRSAASCFIGYYGKSKPLTMWA